MDDYDKELTEKEIEKAAEISAKKKGGKGAAIGMVFFALVAIGLGVWVAILLMAPKESCSKGNTTSGGSSSGGSSEVATTDEFRKSVSDVQALLDEVYNSLKGNSYSYNYNYSTGLPIKISDNLWTTTSLGFGASIEATSGVDAMRNNAIAVLKKHGMSNVTVPHFGAGEPGNDSSHYYKNDDGLYCAVYEVDKWNGRERFNYSCTNDSWLSEQDKELNIALAEAHKQSDEGKQYGATNYIQGWTRSIKTSPSGNYETIDAMFADSMGEFYRKTDGEWVYLTGTQQGIGCDTYNTDELKEAFEGQTCWDSKGNDVTIKR